MQISTEDRNLLKTVRSFLLILMLVLIGSAQTAAPALAAGITVNTPTDEDNTGDSCSLREAIIATNTDAAYGGCTPGSGPDTITLPTGTYTLSLGKQLPYYDSNIIINSENPTSTIIQANANPNAATCRFFEVTTWGVLELNNLTVRHGNCDNATCNSQYFLTEYGYGGGIYNTGILTLKNSIITKNTSHEDGGGIYSKSSTLVVTGSTFLMNHATSGAGLLNQGILNLTGSTFKNNQADGGYGGGLFNEGTMIVKLSTFASNKAIGSGGGGIFSRSRPSDITNSTFYNNSADKGGGIYNYEDMSVTNSTFFSNIATTNGGAFYSDPYQHEIKENRYALVVLKNNILAGSTSGGDCYNYLNDLDVPITGINNLIQTEGSSPCGTTDPIINVDPKLGALTGSPAYLPLINGSPAIDAGDDATCAAANVNNNSQNFIARPQGLHCDIGSVEYSENLYFIYLPIVMKNLIF